MKTITISDEVYEKLLKLKGEKNSFSSIIDTLIKASVEKRIEQLIRLSSLSTGREEELKEIVGSIRKEFKARVYL